MNKNTTEHHVKRGNLIRTLRKIHGWLGLWGAVLGLLFGVSGFLLNHRAVMKVPAVKMEESEVQLLMAQPTPANLKEFTRHIQSTFNINQEPAKPKSSKGAANNKKSTTDVIEAKEARFLGKDMQQPEQWEVSFQLPNAVIHAEYIAGNQYAVIKREDANIWGFITRMHKGVGANAAWVLLVDSLAGALILLSITGVLLWTKMRGSRLAMTGLIGSSLILTVWFSVLMI